MGDSDNWCFLPEHGLSSASALPSHSSRVLQLDFRQFFREENSATNCLLCFHVGVQETANKRCPDSQLTWKVCGMDAIAAAAPNSWSVGTGSAELKTYYSGDRRISLL